LADVAATGALPPRRYVDDEGRVGRPISRRSQQLHAAFLPGRAIGGGVDAATKAQSSAPRMVALPKPAALSYDQRHPQNDHFQQGIVGRKSR